MNANRFSMYGALGADMGKWGRIDVTGSYADDDYTTEIGAAPVMPGDMFYVADDKPYALKSERHPEADYREVYNDFANNYMNRKVWDVSVQYVYQITDWMKLKERFTYFHSDLDYHCIEGLSYRTSKDPIYKWYYINTKDEKVYVDLDTVQRGNAARQNPLNFNPDLFCITIHSGGRIIVLILPNIMVMAMMICGVPVWMCFCLYGILILCRGGGIQKFLPFLFARKGRMGSIYMTWLNLMINGR